MLIAWLWLLVEQVSELWKSGGDAANCCGPLARTIVKPLEQIKKLVGQRLECVIDWVVNDPPVPPGEVGLEPFAELGLNGGEDAPTIGLHESTVAAPSDPNAQ